MKSQETISNLAQVRNLQKEQISSTEMDFELKVKHLLFATDQKYLAHSS